jgi:hypothetical protein
MVTYAQDGVSGGAGPAEETELRAAFHRAVVFYFRRRLKEAANFDGWNQENAFLDAFASGRDYDRIATHFHIALGRERKIAMHLSISNYAREGVGVHFLDREDAYEKEPGYWDTPEFIEMMEQRRQIWRGLFEAWKNAGLDKECYFTLGEEAEKADTEIDEENNPEILITPEVKEYIDRVIKVLEKSGRIVANAEPILKA